MATSVAAQRPTAYPVGTSGAGAANALILVVERDPHVRALERARLLRPRIVITEILVPKRDGLSVCRAPAGG